MRSIVDIRHAETVNMGGILLDQALPVGDLEQIDPFLLIHHWNHTLSGGRRQRDLGVGPHPHRGFSPVTFVFRGAVHHRDSRGYDSVVAEGGTQWMHAGSGITHSERPARALAERGGPFEIVQIWINEPARQKMTEPLYIPLPHEKIPIVRSPEENGTVAVVAGDYRGVTGPVAPLSPLAAFRLDLAAGAEVACSFPATWNVLIYQLDGQTTINGSDSANGQDLVHFAREDGDVAVRATAQTRALLLAGEPIGEPVATYGPIVMNTRSEIVQAVHDAQSGAMGTLVESFDDE